MIVYGLALAAVGGGLGSGMVWAADSLNIPARPRIELAIAVVYGVALLVLLAVLARAPQRARTRLGDDGIERARLEADWTARLSNELMAAAGRLEQHQAQTAQAVRTAISGGGIAAIAAGIANLVTEPTRSPSPIPDGNGIQAQASMTVARRVLAMLQNVLQQLDALERKTDDPAALKALYDIDELVTRIRRAVETLAVLGGATPRSAPEPVDVHVLLRQAVAEIEDYQRVQILPPVEGRVHGVAAADVIHLLAELMENAARFSSPDTQVTVRVQKVNSGLAIDIDDRGLGMDQDACERACALLAGRDREQIFQRLGDGQLGFVSSAAFANRHGIAVRVESNVVGGIHSLALLPHTLLDVPSAVAAQMPPAQARSPLRASVAMRPGTSARSGHYSNHDPDSIARPTLPRREGSYLPEPGVPEPGFGPGSGPVRLSPGLLAGFQSGLRSGGDDQPSNEANGYEQPWQEA